VVLAPISAREHLRRSSALGKRRYRTNLPCSERSRPAWHQERVENAANACSYRLLRAVPTTSQLPQQRRLRPLLSTMYPDLVRRCPILLPPCASYHDIPAPYRCFMYFHRRDNDYHRTAPLFISSRTPLHCRKTPTTLTPFTLSSAVSPTLPKPSTFRIASSFTSF
jgi:hypothetical protein